MSDQGSTAENDAGRIDALRIESGGVLTLATRHDGLIEAQSSGDRVVLDREAVVRLAAWLTKHDPDAEKDAGRITIKRPQIYTGPARLSVDEATVIYLREAATRVRSERYWGSGVTALVSDLLDNAAAAIEADTSVLPPAVHPADRVCMDCEHMIGAHRGGKGCGECGCVLPPGVGA